MDTVKAPTIPQTKQDKGEYTNNTAAILVDHVFLSFGPKQVLKDITWSVPSGQITTLIGPNGCGKSTLLKAMIGHNTISEGSIYIQKEPLSSYTNKSLAQYMAFLPQVPDMPRDMTVEELVYCGRFPYQAWWKNTAQEDRLAVDEALEITKTSHLREQLIPSLSGGERQRVWIAMALAQQPQLLVLDEPTTYLDINHQFEIMELLKRLNETKGLTVLMVLHELNLAAQYSHHIGVMQEGRLVTTGSAQEVITESLLHDIFHVRSTIETVDEHVYVKIKGLCD